MIRGRLIMSALGLTVGRRKVDSIAHVGQIICNSIPGKTNSWSIRSAWSHPTVGVAFSAPKRPWATEFLM